MTLALMLAAAAATEMAVNGAPEVSGGGWISGDTLTTILSILAGAGGVVGGKMWGEKSARKVQAEVKQPFEIEQSAYQAAMKNNEKDHTDLFGRLRILESEVAGIKATITAKFDGLSAQMMETREMVRSLYDKVCNGGKRK